MSDVAESIFDSVFRDVVKRAVDAHVLLGWMAGLNGHPVSVRDVSRAMGWEISRAKSAMLYLLDADYVIKASLKMYSARERFWLDSVGS